MKGFNTSMLAKWQPFAHLCISALEGLEASINRLGLHNDNV